MIFGLLTSSVYLYAFAQSATSNVNASQFTATTEAYYCPALNALTRDSKTRTWSAPNGWKSYDQSFANTIGQFLGAQWIGIEIGQVACIYAGKNKYTFPIVLIHNTLVKKPTGSLWARNANGANYHCVSHQISQCPFHPIVNAANSSSDMKNAIDTIQHNPVQSQMNF